MLDQAVYHKVLKGLLEVESADEFYFHQRFALGPGDIIRAIRELREQGLLEQTEEGRHRITTAGKKYLFLHKKSYKGDDQKPWTELAPHMVGEQIGPDAPYFPKTFDKNNIKKFGK